MLWASQIIKADIDYIKILIMDTLALPLHGNVERMSNSNQYTDTGTGSHIPEFD